jgi:hypothetical protein
MRERGSAPRVRWATTHSMTRTKTSIPKSPAGRDRIEARRVGETGRSQLGAVAMRPRKAGSGPTPAPAHGSALGGALGATGDPSIQTERAARARSRGKETDRTCVSIVVCPKGPGELRAEPCVHRRKRRATRSPIPIRSAPCVPVGVMASVVVIRRGAWRRSIGEIGTQR